MPKQLHGTPTGENGLCVSRRRILKNVSVGVLGCGLADLLALEAKGWTNRSAKARNVLVIYEEGGISQMDSWDPKPLAPVDHRSPFPPISTSVPGIHYSSLMPKIAGHADKLAVVRSMTTTKVAGHIEGCLEFFKGYRFNSPSFGIAGNDYRSHRFPDIGSVATEILGSDCKQIPGYVLCPGANLPNLVGNSGFLPPGREPWKLGTKSLGENLADPQWRVRSLDALPDLSTSRMNLRRELLDELDRSLVKDDPAASTVNRFNQYAYDLLTSPRVQAALSFGGESASTLDRYGRDHRGMSYLMGRKLIETGVRFVTVTVIQPPELVGRSGTGQPNGVFLNWDHHEGIYVNGPCGGPQAKNNQERFGLPHAVMMPSLDRSFSALLEDMHERGLLDETLVCFITEMGRTPRINKWQGRDHWARAMSIAFAGAGIEGGQVIGQTDREAGDVVSMPYTPYDYAETVYRKLGIATEQRLRMADGRQVEFSEGGRPIAELF